MYEFITRRIGLEYTILIIPISVPIPYRLSCQTVYLHALQRTLETPYRHGITFYPIILQEQEHWNQQ